MPKLLLTHLACTRGALDIHSDTITSLCRWKRLFKDPHLCYSLPEEKRDDYNIHSAIFSSHRKVDIFCVYPIDHVPYLEYLSLRSL